MKDHKIIIRDLTPKKFGKRDKLWTISLIVIIISIDNKLTIVPSTHQAFKRLHQQ